ncbi:NLR family member X1 isoform X1 [Ictalurus punctatus]|uniref:NLR family member X1 isoform X1 n=2 Tax=Ictalurus punctatus TaxID=7998 RepID=A0A2D0SSA9_ICTPU|nr:NLR family member X1 isoform X1 [Ictalurus punctatus]
MCRPISGGVLKDTRMWRFGRVTGTEAISKRSYRTLKDLSYKHESTFPERKLEFTFPPSDFCCVRKAGSLLQPSVFNRWMSPCRMGWSERIKFTRSSFSGYSLRLYCSSTTNTDPIELHKHKLAMWFSHLPREEKQFGGYFSPQTMHVEPLILEKSPEEGKGLSINPFKGNESLRKSVTAKHLFDPRNSITEQQGLNILLYGAVGTGKSTVVRKLVLDWCAGSALSQFKLVVPFSCEDLSQLSKSTSLRDLVGRKYVHLRKTPFLSGDNNQASEVLFIFNGMEKMKLDFRIATTELCSDPNEALPAGAVVVNLLRKYLLPEASILVTTRLSAVDRIPKKYVNRYAQICGFSDPDRQRTYFTSRLLQQSGEKPGKEAESLIEMLYFNLQRESQLATACLLPSYCWLMCATLHFLHFTDAKAPIRTLTGIYTSFLRLNFGGEVLTVGGDIYSPEEQNSLMLYVVRTVGKLAFDGVNSKHTSFSETDLEQWVGGKTKTDEELQQLAVFRTDVLDFFLMPCVEHSRNLTESDEKRYVFAVPAMQEYLAALYVVLGENKTALEKVTKQVSSALGQAGEDITTLMTILSKFIPLRIFALFNLLKLFPKFFDRVTSLSRGRIANTMAAEMFRSEDSYNEDVLDQVEQSLLGVQGPQPQQTDDTRSFELYPIFMGGLLHYGNRKLLEQLGCDIKSTTVAQITRTLKKQLIKESRKQQPPEELMDLLVLLYELQNPRLTAEVLQSVKVINLSNVRMTPLKCFVLSSVLNCLPPGFVLNELNLSSCHITPDLLHMLYPAFNNTRSLNLQFNSLDSESCILLRDLLLESNCKIKSLQLCDNSLLDRGASHLLDALSGNQSLQKLSLMHTGLGDSTASELAARLESHGGLQVLNVAYNNIGDGAALKLVDACREHATIHTLHLYLNQLTDLGKQSLHVRGVPQEGGRRVKVLASVTEGSDISEDWHPILSIIGKNSLSWERERVREQLLVFLKDLEWGRKQHSSFWKKLHFRRVERVVRQTLYMLEKRSTAN